MLGVENTREAPEAPHRPEVRASPPHTRRVAARDNCGALHLCWPSAPRVAQLLPLNVPIHLAAAETLRERPGLRSGPSFGASELRWYHAAEHRQLGRPMEPPRVSVGRYTRDVMSNALALRAKADARLARQPWLTPGCTRQVFLGDHMWCCPLREHARAMSLCSLMYDAFACTISHAGSSLLCAGAPLISMPPMHHHANARSSNPSSQPLRPSAEGRAEIDESRERGGR